MVLLDPLPLVGGANDPRSLPESEPSSYSQASEWSVGWTLDGMATGNFLDHTGWHGLSDSSDPLFPIPPLDGSRILFGLFPESVSAKIFRYEQYSLIILLVFIVFFSDYLYPILAFCFHLLTNLSL